MKIKKDEFLIGGGKSAMMTMRRRPLVDRIRDVVVRRAVADGRRRRVEHRL